MAVVGVRTFDLHIPGPRSLKEKRFVLRSLKDRISNRFNVSVCETGYTDKWQRAELAVAVVCGRRRDAERILDSVLALIDDDPDLRVIESVVDLF